MQKFKNGDALPLLCRRWGALTSSELVPHILVLRSDGAPIPVALPCTAKR
jgi:hypothetical protein